MGRRRNSHDGGAWREKREAQRGQRVRVWEDDIYSDRCLVEELEPAIKLVGLEKCSM